MSTLRNVDRRKLIKALRQLGFELNTSRGKGSHVIAYHPGDLSRSTSIPSKSPVPIGTLRKIMKDLVITAGQLEEFL